LWLLGFEISCCLGGGSLVKNKQKCQSGEIKLIIEDNGVLLIQLRETSLMSIARRGVGAFVAPEEKKKNRQFVKKKNGKLYSQVSVSPLSFTQRL
jgi:hypothetical protein